MTTPTSSLIARLLWLFAAVMVLFLGGACYADLHLLQAFALGAIASVFVSHLFWARLVAAVSPLRRLSSFDRQLFLQRNDPLLI